MSTGEQISADEQRLLERFKAEMRACRHKPVRLTMDVASTWLLLSNLQLALRHPGNVGASADVLRQVMEQLASQILEPGSAMEEVFQRGEQSQ